MIGIQQITSQIVNAAPFRYFILTLILATGAIVGIETYPELHARFSHSFHLIDQTIIFVFAIEIILKILAKGSRPWDYFKDPWNVFDFIIVAICFIPNIDSHFVTVFRLARILRFFRIISILPKLQLLVNTLLKSIPSMGYVVLLLFLVFYIYAVLGSFLFAKTDPVHFGSLHTTMISLFKILTLEGWTDIMDIQLYGTHDPNAKYMIKPGSLTTVIYFVSFILLGAMIIMNLFIGVIMNSMQESQNDLQKELMKKQRLETGTQTLLNDLDEKIDGLKLDMQKLNDILKK